MKNRLKALILLRKKKKVYPQVIYRINMDLLEQVLVFSSSRIYIGVGDINGICR